MENTEITKKTRQKIYITGDNGEQVLAERVWGSAVFTSEVAKELRQWARETENDLTAICENILREGLAPHIKSAFESRDARNAARKALKSTNVATIGSPEQLEQLALGLEAKLAAIRERAAALRAGNGGVTEVALDQVLGTDSDPDVPSEDAPTTPTARRNRS